MAYYRQMCVGPSGEVLGRLEKVWLGCPPDSIQDALAQHSIPTGTDKIYLFPCNYNGHPPIWGDKPIALQVGDTVQKRVIVKHRKVSLI